MWFTICGEPFDFCGGTIQKVTNGIKKEIHIVLCQTPFPLKEIKVVWSLNQHICMHPPHLHASLVIYIHYV